MHYVDPLEASRRGVSDLEDLARLDSPVHRLGAVAKTLATLVLAATAISFPRYSLIQIAPLALYPAFVIGIGRLPVRALLRRLLPAAPFILLIGAANPFLDRTIAAHIGGVAISGGWLSFSSIAARLALTLLAGLLLAATTGICDICLALERLGLPRILATQVLLMVRFFFVLANEGSRILRAHALRSGGRGVALKLAGPLAGQWLLRAFDRAGRIHQAMLARGFDGTMHRLSPPPDSMQRSRDLAWVFGWTAFCLAVRLLPVSETMGRLALEAFGR